MSSPTVVEINEQFTEILTQIEYRFPELELKHFLPDSRPPRFSMKFRNQSHCEFDIIGFQIIYSVWDDWQSGEEHPIYICLYKDNGNGCDHVTCPRLGFNESFVSFSSNEATLSKIRELVFYYSSLQASICQE